MYYLDINSWLVAAKNTHFIDRRKAILRTQLKAHLLLSSQYRMTVRCLLERLCRLAAESRQLTGADGGRRSDSSLPWALLCSSQETYALEGREVQARSVPPEKPACFFPSHVQFVFCCCGVSCVFSSFFSFQIFAANLTFIVPQVKRFSLKAIQVFPSPPVLKYLCLIARRKRRRAASFPLLFADPESRVVVTLCFMLH